MKKNFTEFNKDSKPYETDSSCIINYNKPQDYPKLPILKLYKELEKNSIILDIRDFKISYIGGENSDFLIIGLNIEGKALGYVVNECFPKSNKVQTLEIKKWIGESFDNVTNFAIITGTNLSDKGFDKDDYDNIFQNINSLETVNNENISKIFKNEFGTDLNITTHIIRPVIPLLLVHNNEENPEIKNIIEKSIGNFIGIKKIIEPIKATINPEKIEQDLQKYLTQSPPKEVITPKKNTNININLDKINYYLSNINLALAFAITALTTLLTALLLHAGFAQILPHLGAQIKNDHFKWFGQALTFFGNFMDNEKIVTTIIAGSATALATIPTSALASDYFTKNLTIVNKVEVCAHIC
jgi:hypothetical protein